MSTEKAYVTWEKEVSEKGEFKRQDRTFRDAVTKDGSSGFKAEKDRYHLYISLACPWAHRALILRKLKGLDHAISVDVVDYFLDKSTGWTLQKKDEFATEDSVNGTKFLRDVYFKANPEYEGSYTVPVLWDKVKQTMVNNESSEIIRMLNSEFNEWAKHPEVDLFPEHLRPKIEEVNEWVYHNINNGVYKCGFAQSQEAYDSNVKNLFDHLEKTENILKTSRYLCGSTFTEADVRLFTTLVRFDAVYVTHFKTNKKRLSEYPNISGYMREISQMPGVAETINMKHIKHHYFESHKHINPTGIVPIGLEVDLVSPHNRENLA